MNQRDRSFFGTLPAADHLYTLQVSPLYSLTGFLAAGVVELVDAPDSKSGGGNPVRVRVSPPALFLYSSDWNAVSAAPRS